MPAISRFGSRPNRSASSRSAMTPNSLLTIGVRHLEAALPVKSAPSSSSSTDKINGKDPARRADESPHHARDRKTRSSRPTPSTFASHGKEICGAKPRDEARSPICFRRDCRSQFDLARETMNTASPIELIFGLAAIYNIAFGLWTCLWPQTFFEWMKMVPRIIRASGVVSGMVVGLYGLLYAYAASPAGARVSSHPCRPDRKNSWTDWLGSCGEIRRMALARFSARSLQRRCLVGAVCAFLVKVRRILSPQASAR